MLEVGGNRTGASVEQFGDSRRLADELLAAVTDGPKRATSELVSEFRERGDDLPSVGSHWIACDGSGSPLVVLRSIELRIGTFDDVDERFAVVWPPELAG